VPLPLKQQLISDFHLLRAPRLLKAHGLYDRL
jgi:hypothetical protein